LAEGKYAGLLGWLREKIHRHGRRYPSRELMLRATGEPLRADYFLDYLKTKYGG
jgi:carboxypeptidase Taq